MNLRKDHYRSFTRTVRTCVSSSVLSVVVRGVGSPGPRQEGEGGRRPRPRGGAPCLGRPTRQREGVCAEAPLSFLRESLFVRARACGPLPRSLSMRRVFARVVS